MVLLDNDRELPVHKFLYFWSVWGWSRGHASPECPKTGRVAL